jgi:hypothetical protein
VIWWPAEGHEVFHPSTLANVPNWILELMRPKPAPTVVHLATARPVSPRQVERQLDGIIRTIALAPEGQRNSILFWGTCRLRELVERGELSEDMARRLIVATGMRTGLPVSEIERTFDGAFRRAMGSAVCR